MTHPSQCPCIACQAQAAVAEVLNRAAQRPGGADYNELQAGVACACAALFIGIDDNEKRARMAESFAANLPAFVEIRRKTGLRLGWLRQGGNA